MESLAEGALLIREWIAAYNFYVSAGVSLSTSICFVLANRRHQGSNPPIGAVVRVLVESISLSSVTLTFIRLMTGAFSSLQWEEKSAIFFGCVVIAYLLFTILERAFSVATSLKDDQSDLRTQDY